MKRKNHQKSRNRILKFDFDISEIKRLDLYFAITYSEIGSPKTFTDILHWSEIEKPKRLFLEIQKIIIFENDKAKAELTKSEAEKLISLLDYHNTNINTKI